MRKIAYRKRADATDAGNALHHAARKLSDGEIVKSIPEHVVQAGEMIREVDVYGNTPLYYCMTQ